MQRKRNSEEDRAKSQPSEDMQLPVVSGYEVLERRRGVRRPERKLTRREKRTLKKAEKLEKNRKRLR